MHHDDNNSRNLDSGLSARTFAAEGSLADQDSRQSHSAASNDALDCGDAEERVSLQELAAFRAQFGGLQDGEDDVLDDLADGFMPDKIGRFEIQERIGSGTFGCVYLAYDPKLTRNVAIKVAHLGPHSNRQLRHRFLREAHAAARLAHQNVVSLHEYGDENGLLYLVYELCEGPTLDEWMAEQPDRLEPRTAVRIISELASGLGHAHSRGLVHRDVKPGNILLQPKADRVGEDELEFTPRITDFGLAYDFLSRDKKSNTGGLFGTIDFMPPEQALGEAQSIQPVSDLYSLGVILYRMLTGKLPFAGSNVVDTLRRICSQPPVSLRNVNPEIPKDLEAICLKCLQKNPKSRYSSCDDLRRDLTRYLNRVPVSARPQSKFETAYHVVSARPMVSTLIGSIIAVCLISAIVFSKMAADLQSNQQELEDLLSFAVATQSVAVAAQRETQELLETVRLQRDEAQRQAILALQSSYQAELYRAYQAWNTGQILAAADVLDGIRSSIEGQLEPGCDFRLLAASLEFGARRLGHHRAPATETKPIAGTDIVVSAGRDGGLHFYNVVTGNLEHSIQAEDGFEIDALAISSDSKKMAVGYVNKWFGMGHTKVHPLQLHASQSWLGEAEYVHFAPSTIESLDFSPCGSYLAIGARYAPACICSLNDEANIKSYIPTNGRNRSLSFSPDGSRCLVTDKSEKMLVVDSASGETLKTFDCGSAYFAVWSPDGKWIAYCCRGDESVCLIDLHTNGNAEVELTQPYGRVECFAFDASGNFLSAGTQRGGVAVWQLDGVVGGQQRAASYAGILHNGLVPSVCMPSEDYVTSVSDTGSVISTRMTENPLKCIEPGSTAGGIVRSSDKEFLVAGNQDGRVVVYDFGGKLCKQLVGKYTAGVNELRSSPDGRWLAVGWDDGRIALIDCATGALQECRYPAPADSLDERAVRSLCFSDDSSLLAVCGEDARLRVWEISDVSKPLWEYRTLSMAYATCFVGNNRLALGGMFEELLMMDARSGAIIQSIAGASNTHCLTYDRQRDRLISGHAGGKIRIFDGQQLALIETRNAAAGVVQSLWLTPSGDCFLSGDSEGNLRVWRGEDGRLVGTLRSFTEGTSIRGIEFCPQKRSLVVHHSTLDSQGRDQRGFALVGLP